MKREKKIWFKAKNYGWGWYPVAWQGWILVLTYIVGMVSYALVADANAHSGSDALIGIALPFIALTSLLLGVCYMRGEKPAWRWGEK